VEVMLDGITSTEYRDWRAFEIANGPLDGRYSDEALASIHEQLQVVAFLVGAQLAGKRKNPVPKPKHFPRPSEAGKSGGEQAE
jgi:hypothetical protein